MKIKIEKKVIKEINMELPYYYKSEHSDENGAHDYYGKIEKNSAVTIGKHLHYEDETENWEIEKHTFKAIEYSGYCCYFEKEHKSTGKEFRKAKVEALKFIFGLK